MKKLFICFFVALLIGALVGCGMNKPNSENENINGGNNQKDSDKVANENKEPESQLLTIKDFYQMKKDTRYIYEGNGNEFSSYTLYFDYIADQKGQQRIDNGGTVIASVVELKDGKLTKVFSRGEAYYRENFLEATGEQGEILLKEPLQKGTTWTLKDSRKRTITNTSVDITTPTGNYKAIEVTTESGNDKTVDYYAKDVGLVKTVFNSGDNEITSTLAKIEENVALTQTINFYYPNIDDDKIYYKKREIHFNTNDMTKMVLAKAYKELPNNQIGVVFSNNTSINSLYLNNDHMVYIDLNQNFVNEMNAGAGYEGMILQSIANTFGEYYNSKKVYLTIDNKPYESGHFSMKKGEFLNVKTNETIELK
jgi:hypothetical protein